MAIVLDANLLVSLAIDDDRAPAVEDRIARWLSSGEDLHAPALLPYEVANGLTRLVAGGLFPEERLTDAWTTLSSIPLTLHPLADHGDEMVTLALRLRRQSAYDAAYLALANHLGAELWTFDGPLARNAAGLGFPVNLLR